MTYGTLNVDKITDSGGVSSGGLYGFKNRILNGAMMIDQRNAGASVTLSSSAWTFPVDRFSGYEDTDGVMTAQQVSDAPAGFINSIKCTATTADASLSATQRVMLRQTIEGLNLSDLAWGSASAATITISFWVKSSLTGTFGGSVQNSASNRAYPFTYSISSANTWEQKSVTVAGDTTGTWLTTNGVGMQLMFGLGVGTTYSAAANAWAAGEYNSATGATSVIGTLNATWQITGVQLEKGSTATSFDYRPYGTELALCQRYAYVQSGLAGDRCGFGYCGTSTLYNLVVPLPVTMRSAPSLVSCSSVQINDNNSGYNSSAITIGDQITNTCVNLTVTSSGMTIGRGAQAYWSPSSGSMVLSAEL